MTPRLTLFMSALRRHPSPGVKRSPTASCSISMPMDEDSLAFGSTAIGGNYSSRLCALSYQRINHFERIPKGQLWRALITGQKAA
jgi:hypothetical protein